MTRWRLADRTLEFPPPLAAGIVNVTADSFFEGARCETPERAVADGLALAEAGFDLLDVGAVAARSGPPVSADEEAARLVPAVEGLARRAGVPVTADTFRPRSRAGRSTPAPRRSTTSPAAPTRDARPGGRARAAATCSCTSRARRASIASRRAYGDPVAHLKRWFGERIQAALEQLAWPRSRSRSIPASTSTSRSTTTSRSCGASVSCASSAGRCSWRCRARTSSGRCWRAPGRAAAAGRRARVGDRGGDGAGRRRRGPRWCGCTTERAGRAAARRPRSVTGRGVRRTEPNLADREWLAAGAAVAAATGWERAIEPGRADGRLVAESVEAARTADRVALPAALAPELAAALPASGIERALLTPARGARGGRRAERDRHQRHRVGQVAVLQPARARPARPRRRRPGALPLPDQGPRPGPGAQAVRARPAAASPRDLRRRHAARGPARDPASLEPDPHQPRHAPRRRSCPTTRAGGTSSPAWAGWSWTRPTPTAACSGRTSPTSCAGCAGSRASTAPAPGSSSPRRRSPTRWSSPSAWSASPSAWSTPTGLRAPGGGSGSGTRRSSTRGSMTRRSVLSEAAELLADLVGEGVRTICFLRSRRGIELIQRFARSSLEELGRPQLAERIAPYRAGYTPQQRREIEARLRGRRAARGRRHRRARAGDRHRGAGRGDLRHLPRHGREPAADVGAGGAAHARDSPSTSPARTRWTSSSAAIRRSSWSGRWRRRSSTTRTSGSSSRTCSPRPTRRRSSDADAGRATTRCSASGGASEPTPWSRSASCGAVATGATCHAARGFPAGDISLRSASPDSVAIVERASGELLGSVEAERAFTTVHPGAVYLHLGRSYEVRELDIEGRRAVVERLRRRLVHAAEEGDRGVHRADRRKSDASGRPTALGHRAVLRRGLGHRAGDGLPAQAALRSPGGRHGRRSTCRRRTSPPRRSGTCSATSSPARGASARGPARRAARRRARPDRGAAAARDVRPLGHRRPVDQRPLPDRPADDLHLRRLSRRGGDRAARLRASSSAWSPTPRG